MRRFINRALGRKKATSFEQSDALLTDVLPQKYIMAGPAHAQLQCILFRMVSSEVRLLIYEAALSDPGRLLHIVPYRGKKRRQGVGHWRCEDTESPLPTWQHSCFGVWAGETGICNRIEPRSESNLVSLLLTCRLAYTEAIEVLYNANMFSFYGANGLLSFKSLVPKENWERIRRINISTVFLMPMSMSGSFDVIPPENYDHWEKACSAIGTLDRLQLLTIDFTLWNFHDWKTINTIEHKALISILCPLKKIQAKVMEVETNVEVPELIKSSLGPLTFKLKQQRRPFGDIFDRY